MGNSGLIALKTCAILAVMATAVLRPASGPASATVPALGDVTAMAAGGAHTCAITATEGIKCWGYNNYGQLGDGTTTSRAAAVDVVGLGTAASAVSAGSWHTCVLTAAGSVKCWGENSFGQLGTGTVDARKTVACSTAPLDVSGLGNNVIAVAAGGDHSCALAAQGGVKCWGSNSAGQLGDGTTAQSATPVDVSGLSSGVAAIAAGSRHTCALTVAGSVKCWGQRSLGRLGDGVLSTTSEPQATPVEVLQEPGGAPLSGIAAIAAGSAATCAVTTAQVAKCWGWNVYGKLGDGTTTHSAVPVDVANVGKVVAIAPGSHTCALTATGGLKCWGRNDSGQLGDGTSVNEPPFGSPTPKDVVGLNNGVSLVSVGTLYSCAATAGQVKCWGSNIVGSLGDGTTTAKLTPVQVLAPVVGADNDLDGCTDRQELSLEPTTGGRRDYKYFWDFYDVWTHPPGDPIGWERNKRVNVFDILGVAGRFGPGTAKSKEDALAAALMPPVSDSGYHAAFDRGPIIGANNWDVAPADGAINLPDDILGVARQFGHNCL